MKDDKKNHPFAKAYICVLHDEALSWAAKCLYFDLRGRCFGESTFCFPSQATIAKDLGISERNVRRYLDLLKMSGLISIKKTQKGNQYHIEPIYSRYGKAADFGYFNFSEKDLANFHPDKTVRSHRTKLSGPTGQNCPPNKNKEEEEKNKKNYEAAPSELSPSAQNNNTPKPNINDSLRSEELESHDAKMLVASVFMSSEDKPRSKGKGAKKKVARRKFTPSERALKLQGIYSKWMTEKGFPHEASLTVNKAKIWEDKFLPKVGDDLEVGVRVLNWILSNWGSLSAKHEKLNEAPDCYFFASGWIDGLAIKATTAKPLAEKVMEDSGPSERFMEATRKMREKYS